MDTKKLRQKVLDLAIRGKLVPQDPNDEPASVLLERIREEKERLIKEGKIKRDKKEKENDTFPYKKVPFEVPEGWVWVKLGETCQIKGGKRIPLGKTFSPEKTNHIYIRVTDMKKNTILADELKYIDDDVFEAIKNYTIGKDDLYLTIAGTIGTVGIVPPMFDGMSLTENAVKLTSMSIDKYYLLYCLSSQFIQEQFSSRFHQVAQPKLSIETSLKTLLAIPPLQEQQRIVQKIERCFALIDQVEESKLSLSQFIKQTRSKVLDLAIRGKLVPQDPNDEPASALLGRICNERKTKQTPADISHYPFEIPKNWVWCKMGEIFDFNPKNILNDELLVSFIPMTLISDNFSNKHTCEIRKWEAVKKGFTHFQEGDVGIAKITPCFENRKSIVFQNLKNDFGAGTTELHILRPKNDIVLSGYLLWFVKTDKFVNDGISCFTGAVGQQRVGKNVIKETYFPLPPFTEQKRIVQKIESIFQTLDSIQNNL